MKKNDFFEFSHFVSGCGYTVRMCAGPPIKNPQVTKSNLPQKCFIENVPIYRQTYMNWGPTSLWMVLNFYVQNLSQEDIGKVRRGRGTVVSDMESYPRSLGF